jgi:uncharacterized membrane protein
MFKLKLRDYLKGILMAVVVPALVLIQQSLSAGQITIDWKALGISSVAALIGYLLKNFLTDDIKVAEKIIKEDEAKKP